MLGYMFAAVIRGRLVLLLVSISGGLCEIVLRFLSAAVMRAGLVLLHSCSEG